MNRYEICEVKKVVKENKDVKTLYFNLSFADRIDAGQFIMVWLPCYGERPMALSYIDRENGEVAITVQCRGKVTERIHELKEGDKLGVRGPYGRGFEVEGKVLAVGGGVGVSAFAPLVDEKKIKKVMIGAKTIEELIFIDRFKKSCDVFPVTEDGSYGRKGYVTDFLDEKIKKFDMVISCGPELMLRKVIDTCTSMAIPLQVSLERIVKCGIGVCGSCVIEPLGLFVCKDGPVFDGELLKDSEIGFYKRDKSGKIVRYQK